MAKLLNFTEASSIAIHSMIYVINSDEKVNINQIAENIGASRHHVAKVMQLLVQNRFLKSVRGPKGGFVLLKPVESISIYDIYCCIEGEIDDEHCPADSPYCPPHMCVIGTFGRNLVIELKNKMKEEKLDKFVIRTETEAN